ncbi:hypothetical protein XENTR_v10016830 [Xenopus tropicalis]|nr:hypothetical protein XENTR_v10016830 [Xenopus tropicalis]
MKITMQQLLFILFFFLILGEKLFIISGKEIQYKEEDTTINDVVDNFGSDNDQDTSTAQERGIGNLLSIFKKEKTKPPTLEGILDEQRNIYEAENQDLLYLYCGVLGFITVCGMISAYYCFVKNNMFNILPEDDLQKAEEGCVNDDNSILTSEENAVSISEMETE